MGHNAQRVQQLWIALAFGLSGLVISGCTSIHREVLLRAEIEPELVAKAVVIETNLNAQGITFAPAGTSWFEILEGTGSVIVVAGHATKPTREGILRFSDGGGTAALALALHELNGASVLYTTYASPSDPNYYDDNEFKAALLKLLQTKHPALVLDIHGSHPARPYDVDLGTMGGCSLLGNRDALDDLASCLRREGLTNLSLDRFSAEKNQTITKWCSGHGVPCIQLEISATWLSPSVDDIHSHRFAQLLQALTRFTRAVEQK